MQGELSDRDIRLLKIFVSIADAGSFTAAGAKLNIAESTISSHMATLELRLGIRLCERGRSGFRLTHGGQVVYDAARQLMGQLEGLRATLGGLTRQLSGTLRVGVPDAIVTHPSGLIAAAIGRFATRSDNVQIVIETLSPRELEQQVLAGQLHLAISPEHQRVAGLTYEALIDERNLLYCGSDHPLFSQSSVTIDQVTMAECISRGYHVNFDRDLLGNAPHRATVSSLEAAAHLILSGRFLGFLPTHYAEPWVSRREMRALLPERLAFSVVLALITHGPAAQELIARTFISDLKAAAQAAPSEASLRREASWQTLSKSTS